MVKFAQHRITLTELFTRELPTFIAFDVIIGTLIIVMLFVCPYACARSCCRACKKDHTRSDYRKEEKNKPGIWYLIVAILMLLIDLFIIFELINVFYISKQTICKEALFIDAINLGLDKEEFPDRNWVGA